MRKLATTALTALSITLMGSAAALAAPGQGSQGPGNHGPAYNQQYKAPQGAQYGDRRQGDNDRYRGTNRNFNFTLHFGNFDRWERGWGYGTYQNQFRFHRVLSTWQIERMLERQGYYGVRNLQKARAGFGYRAFAFNQRGRPVMLRVNPYTGRVMDVRTI